MERLLKMIDLLRAERQMTSAELAAQLGISERTLRRDFGRLQALDMAVETRPGRTGGVSLPAGGLLPALRFTDDEVLVLAFGLRQAHQLGDPRYLKAAGSAFRRLQYVMTERLSERIEALIKSLHLTGPPAQRTSSLNATTLLILADAIQHGQRLDVRYRAADGRVSDRPFDPYGLAQVVGHWYVAGYCHARQAIRTFRVDRLEVMRELAETFTPPADFDAVQVITQSIAQTPSDTAHTCQVWVQATLDEVSRAFPIARGTLEEQEDGVLITTHTPPEWLSALAVTLLNLGYPLRVIAPAALNAAFQTLSQRTQAIGEGQVA